MSVQITKEMIASNVPAARRVAPLLCDMSIIDDIYAFAALLRVGPGSPEDVPADRHPATRKVSSMTLRRDIEHAINCNSAENGSNTPDFMLAEFLTDCLAAFDKAVVAREKWYGREPAAPGTLRPTIAGLEALLQQDGPPVEIPARWHDQTGSAGCGDVRRPVDPRPGDD